MRTLLILVILAAVYLILRWQYRANPEAFTRRFLYWFMGALVAVTLFLAVTGRLHWFFALIAGLLPFFRKVLPLLRYLPMLKIFRSLTGRFASNSGAGRASVITSRFFRMTLDYASGTLSGVVLAGEYTGMNLEQLSMEQLKRLAIQCKGDPDSAALLAAYMIRRYGSGWAGAEQQGEHRAEAADNNALSRSEALQVLGLEGEPTREEVIKAHKRLMQKFHPDRGGSNYLAVKINQAKDRLLEN